MAGMRKLAAQRSGGIEGPGERADLKSNPSCQRATSRPRPHMKGAKVSPVKDQEKLVLGPGRPRRSARLSNAPQRQPKHTSPACSQLSSKSTSQEYTEASLHRGHRKRSRREEASGVSHELKRQRTSSPRPTFEDTLLPVGGSAKPGSRAHKRRSDLEDPTLSATDDRPRKCRRTSPVSAVGGASIQEVIGGGTQHWADLIDFWRRKGHWPKKYFKQGNMEHFLARKKSVSSVSSLRRKRSDSDFSAPSSKTPSDQKPREEKSAPYRNPQYERVLKTKGTFMTDSGEGVAESSKVLCQKLLDGKQEVPRESIFDDAVFKKACEKLQGKNEARIIQDISRLIVPSVETLALRAETLEHLTESVNEGWNNSIPLTGTRPQPDYSAGFLREAFTEDQLAKLLPFIGDEASGDPSFFMATYYMCFPFLTCEVKCGAAALDIADRQNAHSMTLAVRAVVQLFRLVKREKELHRQILAFSVSHDHRSVRIYSHYPVINEKDTKYYRHAIRTFDFTELNGKEKWTAYHCISNILYLWVPEHFKRICSAIDELPSELDFDVPPLPETGLCQSLQGSHLSQPETEPAAGPENGSGPQEPQAVTPPSSVPGASKRAKRPAKRPAKK